MALVVFKNREVKTLPQEKAVVIWRVFNGEEIGTAKQRAFVRKVQAIYLSAVNAPDSYLLKREPYLGPDHRKRTSNLSLFGQPEMWWQK